MNETEDKYTFKVVVEISTAIGADSEEVVHVTDLGYSESEWNELGDKDRKAALDEHGEAMMNNMVSIYWEAVDE